MAEEITNNPAPLTARQVAAQNPELNKLREIAFGTSYLDDIDAGTGTARFYSGFGQQPTYTGTNTDQAIADAVTAQAETVAAPDQSSGNGQETSGGITGVSGVSGVSNAQTPISTIDPSLPIYDDTDPADIGFTSAADQAFAETGDYDEYSSPYSGPVGPQFGETGYADPGIDAEENQPYNQNLINPSLNSNTNALSNYPEIGLDSEFIDQAAEDQKLDNLTGQPQQAIDNSMYGGDLELGGDGITEYEATPETQSAWEKVKSGATTAADFIKDFGYTAYKALQGTISVPLNLGLGFAGKVFESLGDTKSNQEYNSYSDEQKAAIDNAYGPGGVMEGYNAVSGFGEGVQATIQNRIDTIDKANTGTAAAAAKREELQGLLNTVDTSKPISTIDPSLSIYDDTDSNNIGFTSEADKEFAETGDYDVYSGGDTGATSSPTPAADYSYEGSDEQDEASNYDSTPSPAPSQPDQRDRGGDGGGGGGGGKIVCTMMNDTYGFGNFRNKIWLRQSKDLAPEYQKGYHKIFLPLVKLSKTNVVIRKVLEHIAVHRTIDIRQEARGKAHILGRIYRKILEPICYLVGKYVK